MKNTIIVNGETYVKQQELSGRVLVRCRNAGVHVGTLVSHDAVDTVLENANRIWRWRGASTLSEVAQRGVERDSYTRIAAMVPQITLTTSDTCEIIPVAAAVDLSEVWND